MEFSCQLTLQCINTIDTQQDEHPTCEKSCSDNYQNFVFSNYPHIHHFNGHFLGNLDLPSSLLIWRGVTAEKFAS